MEIPSPFSLKGKSAFITGGASGIGLGTCQRFLQEGARVTHPRLGEIELLNQAVKLSRTPSSLMHPTPDLGAHTDEILESLGLESSRIAELREMKVI